MVPVRLSTVGSRAFPQTWNDLPDDVMSAESRSTFCHWLKNAQVLDCFPNTITNLTDQQT